MPVSRRSLLAGGAALTATAALAPLPLAAQSSLPELLAAPASTALPGLDVIALSRMGYGIEPAALEAFQDLPGATLEAKFQQYVEQQLDPAAINDALCDQYLAQTRLKIKYGSAPYTPPTGRHEVLGLDLLADSITIADLWPRARGTPPYENWAEGQRPWQEVRVAALLRAVYSRRQLQELLVEFWHNHFNVNINTSRNIAATMPLYDRIMRQHCLGNFRQFMEDVGKSAAMMYYLNNVSNRAGGLEAGNENYARELFELHGLGSDNYLKFYDDRRQVGTLTYNQSVYARGYIDDDVYAAAECFTGWTIDSNTGEFLLRESDHDTGEKTVLSADGYPNIRRNQTALKDGQTVYDLIAMHPGTARFVCTKLCRRLIADDPPQRVIDAAVDVWMANLDADDQIKQVVRTILLSNEFQTSWGRKTRRPFEYLAAYLRATRAELPSDEILPDANDGGYWGNLFYRVQLTGHRIFEWPTPTGHPDRGSFWATTNSLLRCWNLPYTLTQSWGGKVRIDLAGQTNLQASCSAIVDFWIARLCGYSINPSVRQELINFMAQGGNPNARPAPVPGEPNDPQVVIDRLNAMVQLLAMSPDFLMR